MTAPPVTQLARLTTALAGRYALARELGRGGMASVWLARDLRHDRDIAIKVLHPELAAAVGGERFLAEIRTTARLQHPHILPLLDSGEADGLLYYVMPVMSGETLRTRLLREKQLPIPDALRITREVASALDYAHRQGVIHRDIKPENILLHDGQALVADFGIALAVQSAGEERMTQTGLSLGTPQYMSPEQAMGERALDARTDIYALGVVAYEMLTGEPPFTGVTAQSIVSKVLTEQPAPVIQRRELVSPAVDQAILTALEKVPADRFASAREFAEQLDRDEDPGRTGRRRAPAPVRRGRRRMALAAAAAGSAGLALGALLAWWTASPRDGATVRLVARMPAGTALRPDIPGNSFALSPDGSALVFLGQGAEGPRLFMKPMGALDATAIPGTAGAADPQFSPDGRWITFVVGRELKRVLAGGGPVETITKVSSYGSHWGAGDQIAFLGPKGVEIVPAGGGASRQLTTSSPATGIHLSPFIVPTGDAVLFTIARFDTGLESFDVAVVSLKTLAVRTLVEHAFSARVLPNGLLLFSRPDGTVAAARFDQKRLTIAGAPVTVLDSVRMEPGGETDMAVAANGTMVYLSSTTMERRVVRVDRAGRPTVLLTRSGPLELPTMSPDGKRLAARILEPSGLRLWVYDLERGSASRFGPKSAVEEPAWTRDGRAVAVGSRRGMLRVAMDGSDAERVLDSAVTGQAGSWTPDGRRVVVSRRGGDQAAIPVDDIGAGIVVLDAEGGAPVDEVTGKAGQPALSRDGRWLAYTAQEGARTDVYVRRFQGGPGRSLVSSDGGLEPRWSADGRELYYRHGGQVVAVPFSSRGDEPVLGRPAVLFDHPYSVLPSHRMWDVDWSTGSFIMVEGRSEAAGEFVAVMHWLADVDRAVRR